jgi:hypothetical protein
MKQPPVEYASDAVHAKIRVFGELIQLPGGNAYQSLAEQCGLPVELVAELMLTGESRCLFGPDGRLRSAEELRHLAGGRDPKQALDELRAKRYAPGELTPSRAKRELMRPRRRGY